MTQSHHRTWLTAAGVDPEDTPCQIKLETATKEKNKTIQWMLVFLVVSKEILYLGQLFKRPCELEKSRNITTLTIIVTWASCLCEHWGNDIQSETGFLIAHSAFVQIAHCDVIPSRQGEWNSIKNFALLDVFTMASMTSSSIHAFSTLEFWSVRHRLCQWSIMFVLVKNKILTAPVLETNCGTTPTWKVAKTGEWSLVKMSSVQPALQ